MSVVVVQDIRDAGVTVAIADDAAVEDAIAECEEIFNTETKQFFEPIAGTMLLDGDNTTSIFLNVPVISVDSITDTVNSNVLASTDYRVYNGRQHAINDDRRNPKIEAKNGISFAHGIGRWEIIGVFGFTEPNGLAPRQVKSAIVLMVVDKLLTPIIDPGPAVELPEINEGLGSLGPLVEEITDDHKEKYAYTRAASLWDPYESISKFPSVRRTIKNFRAPFGISTQVSSQFTPSQPLPGFPFTPPA